MPQCPRLFTNPPVWSPAPWSRVGREPEGFWSKFWGRGYGGLCQSASLRMGFPSLLHWWKFLCWQNMPGGELCEQNEAPRKGVSSRRCRRGSCSWRRNVFAENKFQIWFIQLAISFLSNHIGTTLALGNQAMQCGGTSVQHFFPLSVNIHQF